MRALVLSLITVISLSAEALAPGQLVPDFSAKNQNGKTVHLSDFKKQFVVVYFYPKDDTPGCTVEAKNFQADLDKLAGLNAVILGVSRQDEQSHQKFSAKYGIKFDLLVDPKGKIGEIFGVGAIPLMNLSQRQSALIGPDGKLIKIYDSVNPESHVPEVLKDIQTARQKTGKNP